MTTLRWTAPPGIRGLIFDCDGTLADTMPAHHCAWVAMLQPHGIAFPEDRFYAMGGMPTAQIIRVLAQGAGVAVHDVDAMVHEKERLFLQMLDAVQPIAPVVAIANAYRNVLPMAVASGGYRDVVGRTLDRLQLRAWFQAMVTAEDTQRHKPEPDVFLEAARRLSVEPAACAVFEDTELGLEAARRAGMLGLDVRPWGKV
ncbi:MAG: HAD family hydrolase [Planctomycetota bacterium]|jgi:HAD superfamily hydrolase (TIGR01509 family)